MGMAPKKGQLVHEAGDTSQPSGERSESWVWVDQRRYKSQRDDIGRIGAHS